jgi:glycosyltransferase involved in cell wall biosynthesis
MVSTASPQFSMIIPGYNESASLGDLVRRTCAAFDAMGIASAELVVVDDGSTDDMLRVAEQLRQQDKRIRIVTYMPNRGLGFAVRTGFEAATGEWIGWVPADGQFNPRDVLDIWRAYVSADMVVTTVPPQMRKRVDRVFRMLLSKSLRWLTQMVLGVDSSRMTGIYLLRRAVFVRMPVLTSTFLYNLLVPTIVMRRGHHVAYAEIPLHPRTAGSSKVANIPTIAKVFYELFRVKLRGMRKIIAGDEI